MPVKVGINGFGRVGRQTLKAILERHPKEITVVAVNDITDSATNAHLLKYDSSYGRFPGTVEVEADGSDLIVNGKKITVFAEKDPAAIPWKKRRRRAGARVHRPLHPGRQGPRAPDRRRQEGPDHGPRQGRGRHAGAGRQRAGL